VLSHVLRWIGPLSALGTEGVEPVTSVVAATLKMREDEVADGNRQSDIVANAPQSKHGFFVVPRVVE
jgi:aspartyl-tRNA(Asn)/glutamyl-tRNA(Gln) amidotransferase subunit C